MAGLGRAVSIAIRAILLLAAAHLALCAWLFGLERLSPGLMLRSAGMILRAPTAPLIVIGDSRVEWARPAGEPVFAAFGGAATHDLVRFTRFLCAISDAPIVVALGVNDTKPDEGGAGEGGMDGALANLAAMADACGDRPVALAQVWPVEPALLPDGADFDPSAIQRINAGLDAMAGDRGIRVIPAPVISGHTVDGVHFTPEAAHDYLRALVGDELPYTLDPGV